MSRETFLGILGTIGVVAALGLLFAYEAANVPGAFAPGGIVSPPRPPLASEPRFHLAACERLGATLALDRAALQAKVPPPWVVRGTTDAPADAGYLAIITMDCPAVNEGAIEPPAKFTKVNVVVEPPQGDLAGNGIDQYYFHLAAYTDNAALLAFFADLALPAEAARIALVNEPQGPLGAGRANVEASGVSIRVEGAGQSGAPFLLPTRIREYFPSPEGWAYLEGNQSGETVWFAAGEVEASGGPVGDLLTGGRAVARAYGMTAYAFEGRIVRPVPASEPQG